MNFQLRTIIAIFLCLVIWIAYDMFVPKPPPPEEGATDGKTPAGQVEGKDGKDGKDGKAAPGDGGSEPGAAPAEADDDPPDAPDPERNVEVVEHTLQNELLSLELTNRSPGRGGVIKAIGFLSDQFAGHKTGTDPFDLDGSRTLEINFADEQSDFRIPRSATFDVREADTGHVTYGYTDDNVDIMLRVDLLAGYEARTKVRIENRTKGPQAHRMHIRSWLGVAGETSRFNIKRGLCRTHDDIEDEDQGDVEDGPIHYPGPVAWGGVGSKYFSQLTVPDVPAQDCEISASDDKTLLVTHLSLPAKTLDAGQSHEYVVGMYYGANDFELLRAFSAVSLPEGDLEEAVDWGILGSVSESVGRLLLSMLRWFYSLTASWGFAIVLLTVVVKVLTLPLTLKQMSSMKRMKEIQPEIAKIKEKYGDDRVKQGQEMQALFGRSGVNPLAGCLPMLVQLPIWFALYSMLSVAVELVHEPFLYLPDLTQSDPFFVLPLALGGMMILQNRIMPTAGDEAQARMMRWIMPIMFTVFMLFLPSGLGVYIFVNIVLSLIQTAVQVGTKSQAGAAPAKS